MNETDKSEPRNPGLWRRYRSDQEGLSGSQGIVDRPDSLILAAYLDGTLSEAERERLESHLAQAPDDLELVLAARNALADGAGPAPDTLVARACALVPEVASPMGNPLYRLSKSVVELRGGGGRFWQPVAWSGAAAAVLLACTIGFQLGQSGYAGVLSVERSQAWEVVGVLGQSTEDFL